MPVPRMVARLNRAGLNKVTSRVVPWAPGFGLVTHHGRRSGREFHTPVNVFTVADGFLIALTYGVESDWVKNVLAEGGCGLTTRSRTYQLTAPRVLHDPSRAQARVVERQILGLLRVYDFLLLKRSDPASN
ncbi:deazaflavin-dependent oxidoreductase (nitroreductase family) [Jatrophihabitans sp. GAS493]|uniref:nitroreductase family deazaflavin-dependent oxidoreductase n=1 Tax=Jatrophihabitans sp. GAS493 TaxID=1907575 RepID=UPI000BB8498D|nr:nitroreductase family deazaflavin-dependent oxidoreductase [Jatrophihabitans sp. GAS493]SOD71731.1 deazaflavin-dependent oxidoreductase (nitroreductase family) [Jatrophihabitans sp. GAS493]